MLNMAKAYKEVHEILKYMSTEEKEKISPEFIKMIEVNMDKEYEFKVNVEQFEKQEMLPETRALLAVLYRDCWATPEEKASIIEKEKREMEEYKIAQEKKNDLSSVITKVKENKEEVVVSSDMVSTNDDSWFSKILGKIKALFNK